MESQATFDLAVQRIKEGKGRDEIVAEMVSTHGAEAEAAGKIVDRLLEQRAEADARGAAVALFKQGKSKADVWDALVARGLSADAATAIVNELAKLRDQAAVEKKAASPPADLGPSPYAASSYASYPTGGGGDSGRLILGIVIFGLGFVVTVATCSSAESGGGGRYIIAWGPMLWGLIMIGRGLSSRR